MGNYFIGGLLLILVVFAAVMLVRKHKNKRCRQNCSECGHQAFCHLISQDLPKKNKNMHQKD